MCLCVFFSQLSTVGRRPSCPDICHLYTGGGGSAVYRESAILYLADGEGGRGEARLIDRLIDHVRASAGGRETHRARQPRARPTIAVGTPSSFSASFFVGNTYRDQTPRPTEAVPVPCLLCLCLLCLGFVCLDFCALLAVPWLMCLACYALRLRLACRAVLAVPCWSDVYLYHFICIESKPDV